MMQAALRQFGLGLTCLALVLGPAVCCCGFARGAWGVSGGGLAEVAHGCCVGQGANSESNPASPRCPRHGEEGQCPSAGAVGAFAGPATHVPLAAAAEHFVPGLQLVDAAMLSWGGLEAVTKQRIDFNVGLVARGLSFTLVDLHTSLTI